MVALFGVALLAISARATMTVFLTMAFELIGFIAMVVPGAASIPFTLKFFGLLGLASGIPLSLGRNRLPWWTLPALAAGVFALLRLALLLGEDWETVRRHIPLQIGAVGGVAAGMLAGRGITEVARGVSRRLTKR